MVNVAGHNVEMLAPGDREGIQSKETVQKIPGLRCLEDFKKCISPTPMEDHTFKVKPTHD